MSPARCCAYDRLQRSLTLGLITNPNDLIYFGEENLAVADLPGLRRFEDGLHDVVDQFCPRDHFELELWKKIDVIFAAAERFGMTLLPSMAAGLGNGDAFHSYFLERGLDGVQLGRLNDCFDSSHSVRPFDPVDR